MKPTTLKSPILSPIERPCLEEFSCSIQKNTTNESYSLTEKGTLAFTTSTKKIKSSFEDLNSNTKFTGNVIEFEEFNPSNKEPGNVTGQFGRMHEKTNEVNFNFVKEIEKNNEFLLRENEDLKRRLISQSKELEALKESISKADKNNGYSSNFMRADKKNEELLKEILVLKQELIEMNQNCKDSDIENIKLKEEIENRGEKMQQLIDKIKNLEKEKNRKEQKTEGLNKEILKSQNFSENENSLIQKNLLYSEKISQMNNLIETQKQIMSKNEKKIDNLLKKLDELTMINNSKSSEISKLKYENFSLKDEVENLNNKFFLKNHEKKSGNGEMEIHKKEKILSMLDENLDNLENSKKMEIQQKIKKMANKSNHLTHASLNFEVSGHFGLHNSEMKEKDYKSIKGQEQNDFDMAKFENAPLQSPKQMTKMNSQKNLSLSKYPYGNSNKENRPKKNLSNEKYQQKLNSNSANPAQNYYNAETEKIIESKKQEKSQNPTPSSMVKSKSKEKKSLTDLNNLVNQITNRRPPKNENSSNSNHSKVDVSGKISNVSKSNRSSSSLKYSVDLGNGNSIAKEAIKSNHPLKQKTLEKENGMIKTDRVASSNFKNFSNLRAPHKMFTSKTGILMNNYLKNTEDDLEEFMRKKQDF